MLFMTSGLTFWHSTGGKDGEAALSHMKRMALIVETGNDDDLGQSTGYGPLGGERRLMYWRDGTDALSPLAQPPSEVLEAVKESGYCRIILLTPGIFAEGWRPDVTNWAAHNVQPELVAAAVDKPTVISGWDLAAVPPGPKPTRRLAPAGSVYYLHLKGKADDIGQWLSDTWLTCLSDDTEDRASGFGLAAIGVFDGAAAQLVIKEDHDA
jgi:CRISPR-associated protein Cmr3